MAVFKNFASNASTSSGTKEASELFTASGTWTKPTKMIGDDAWVTAIGGGGSGRAVGAGTRLIAGGDGGEYVTDYKVTATGNQTVTIGAGGAGVAATSVGNSGGATSFGTLVSVSGGQGGDVAGTSIANWTGGAQGGREDEGAHGFSANGPYGGNGGFAANSTSTAGGGAGLVLDDSGTSGGDVASNAQGGAGYGAGGAGAASGTSGAGAGGAILVKWIETI